MGKQYDYDKTSNQDGGFDFGDATPFSDIGRSLSKRNAIVGHDHIKTRAFVPGGKAVTSQIGEFTKTIIDVEDGEYDPSFWFMYPRFRLTAEPNGAYFELPADGALPPAATVLRPSDALSQGLPVTIQASAALTYRRCDRDDGLTGYMNTQVSGSILAPHNLRFRASAKGVGDLVYYGGVWFRLSYGAGITNFYAPRAFGFAKNYLIAARVFPDQTNGNVYSVMYFLVPLAKLDTIARIRRNRAAYLDGTPVFVGYDNGSVGNTAVLNSVNEDPPRVIDCTPYSQGVLISEAEGNSYWNSEPYAFWPSPADESVFCASLNGAPGGISPDSVKHFKIVDGVLSLKQSYAFTHPGQVTVTAAAYVRTTTAETWSTTNVVDPAVTSAICGTYIPHEMYTYTYARDFSQTDKAQPPRYSPIVDGPFPVYQMLPDGSPMQITVTTSYAVAADADTFAYTEAEDYLETQETTRTCNTVDNTLDTTVVAGKTFTISGTGTGSLNGGYSVTAAYSWGRQYTLRSLACTGTHTRSNSETYTSTTTNGVTTVTANSRTDTETLAGSMFATGETPLVIDPANAVQIWLGWTAGKDSRNTTVSAPSFAAVPYISVLTDGKLHITAVTLHVDIGGLVFTSSIFTAAGSATYTWNVVTTSTGTVALPIFPTGNGSTSTSTTEPEKTWLHGDEAIPKPLLQSYGDGSPSRYGTYICSQKYLVITINRDAVFATHGGGFMLYAPTEAAAQVHINKAFKLTRDANNAITAVTEVDIQAEFGIQADAVFSWAFFA